FHSQRLKFFGEGNRRRFKLELWQMQIDILRFELCALCEDVGGELRFQCTQAIYLVGKQYEKLEIVAEIAKADGGKAVALGVTKSCGFPHHRKIDRRATADMEWFRLRRLVGKWIRPRRFEIEGVRQDEPRQF